MSWKIALLFVAFIFCCVNCAHLQKPRGYYTIVAPGTARSFSLYHVSISLSDFHQPCSFNITIIPSARSRRSISETVVVQPGTTELVKIRMPSLVYGHGFIEVLCFQGIVCLETGNIATEDVHFMSYIQTSKPKYAPGELVEFRVLCLNRLTRPAEFLHTITVLVYDGQANLIRKMSDVKLVQGVYRGELQLSEYPVLGEWKIVVQVAGQEMAAKSFNVATYVLPTFSVKISTKHDVAYDEGYIVLTVKASYTYGEPVKGDLKVWLRSNSENFEARRPVNITDASIDGHLTMRLDFKTSLNISRHFSEDSISIFRLQLEAEVQEQLTKQSAKTETEVLVHRSPFQIKVEVETLYDHANIKVRVTDLDNNSIEDTQNPVTIVIKKKSYRWASEIFNSGPIYLNSNSIVALTFNTSNHMEYTVHANYLGWRSDLEVFRSRIENNFDLQILTESPEVDKELVVQLEAKDPIEHFVYEVISRGNIIQSERIVVPGNNTAYFLRINTTHEMTPKLTLFVHRVKNRIFDSRLKDVYIRSTFQNRIEILADKQVNPGSLVSINVTTNEDSYVGLMGIDQKLLLDIENADLTQEHIFTKLRNFDSINMNAQQYPGSEAGLLTFSNSYNRYGMRIGHFGSMIVSGPQGHPLAKPFDEPSVELPTIRKIFSDSWMYKDFEKTTGEGFVLNEAIPDTITSWAITGFSLNPRTGLSLTRSPANIKVFKDFFISADFPHQVKEGEILEIPIYIHNYMNQSVLANVTFHEHTQGFEFLECPSSDSQSEDVSGNSVLMSIPAKERAVHSFCLRTLKAGRFNVTVSAVSSARSDAVQKTLNVESEGVPCSVSKTYLVNFDKESKQDNEITVAIDVPENIIPDSDSVQVSAIGDIFGQLSKSLDKLVRVPYGNGEDTVKYMVANLLVLKYLKASNQSNPSLESKAIIYLQLGYQALLRFKHLDGSFSLLDWQQTSETTGDAWLTAYVIWGLCKAKQHIEVEMKVISRGLQYLVSMQAENGGFRSRKDSDVDMELTAFVLMVFLVSQEGGYKQLISKGLAYLSGNLEEEYEHIHAAFPTYVLALGKHEKSSELFAQLVTQTDSTDKPMVWTKPDTLESSLATTAGIFLRLLQAQSPQQQRLLSFVRALISIASEVRTPTNMIALEAMTVFTQDLDLGRKDLKIIINDGSRVLGGFHVNSNNAQVLQSLTVDKTCRKIHLQNKGHGFAIIHVNYIYNRPYEYQALSKYQTNVTVNEPTAGLMALEVCIAMQQLKSQSNLTALEVNLPSGYSFGKTNIDEIMRIHHQIKSVQINTKTGSVLVYIENITDSATCIRLEALKTFNIFNLKPGSVVVHDLHSQSQDVVSFSPTQPREVRNVTRNGNYSDSLSFDSKNGSECIMTAITLMYTIVLIILKNEVLNFM